MISAEGFQSLVLQIYRAALDPSGWQQVVDRLSELSGDTSTHLIGVDTFTDQTYPSFHVGYDDATQSAYREHFQFINPWFPGWANVPTGEVVQTEAVLSSDELRKTEFWADWLRPQGDISSGAGVVLAREQNSVVMLGGNIRINQSEKHKEQWLDLIKMSAPLIMQAMDISRQFSGLHIERVALQNGIEPNAVALWALTGKARIAFANPLAQQITIEGRMATIDALSRLVVRNSTLQSALEAKLSARNPTANIAMTIPDNDGIFDCRLIPVDAETAQLLHQSTFGIGQTPILLLSMRKTKPTTSISQKLVSAFRLTEAEAQIAVLIADGMTANEISEIRQASIHTVRNQLKSALSKVEVRRQTDLAVLVERMRRG